MTRSEQLRKIADRKLELSHLLMCQASAEMHASRVKRELELLAWYAVEGEVKRAGGEA